MLIAQLAVLGVDLSVIIALMAIVLARKRWVSRQPGAFKGAIRVTEGEVPGLKAKWKRGYGRWIRDILIWTNKPEPAAPLSRPRRLTLAITTFCWLRW